MKIRLWLAVLALDAAAISSGFSADPKPAVEKNVAAPHALAGTFAGKWMNDGGEGPFRLKLKQVGTTWTAESSFTLDDTEIATETVSIKVDGSKFELVVKWLSQGNPAQTRLIGVLSGQKIEGTFHSRMGDETVEGTWTATRT